MNLWLGISVVFAITDWWAVIKKNKRLEYLAKPATLFTLTLWFAIFSLGEGDQMRTVFLTGLAFSLLGDIFLMLPERHFLKGLIAFLLAHVAYIFAFNTEGLVVSPLSIAMAGFIVLIAALLLQRIVASLIERGRSSMVAPVSLYALVLSLTLWSASTTLLRADWPRLAGVLAAVGGMLFFISDAAIAWNRFVGPHRGGRIFEMMSYHLAQYALSISVLLAAGVFA